MVRALIRRKLVVCIIPSGNFKPPSEHSVSDLPRRHVDEGVFANIMRSPSLKLREEVLCNYCRNAYKQSIGIDNRKIHYDRYKKCGSTDIDENARRDSLRSNVTCKRCLNKIKRKGT